MTGKLTGGLLAGAATAALALAPAATSAQTNINFSDLCNVPSALTCNGASATNIGIIDNPNANSSSGAGAFIINAPTNTISQSATAIHRSNVNAGGVVTHAVGGGFVPSAALGVGGAANTGGASF